MTRLIVGFALGAAVFGGVLVKYERVRVARSDLAGAKAMVKTARGILWRAVAAFLAAAAGPLLVAAILAALYLIGEHGGD